MTYVVIGSPKVRPFRVVWMLEELGLDYELRPFMPRTDEVKTLSAPGKVPLLLVGDEVISDSAAILTYLSDTYSKFTYPAGTLERGQQDAWTFRILDELESPLWSMVKHSFGLPDDLRSDAALQAARAEFNYAVANFWNIASGPFLMGDKLTVPDFLLVHIGDWAEQMGVDPLPVPYQGYLKRIKARPGYQRAAAIRAG